MFSHVMFGVNDLEVSKKFYDALLGTLGIGPGVANKSRYFYRSPTSPLRTAMAAPSGLPCSHRNNVTHSMRPASPTAAALVKTHRAGAKARQASCTWPICAIRTTTKFVRCTGLPNSRYRTHRNVRFNLRRPSSACSPSASAVTPW